MFAWARNLFRSKPAQAAAGGFRARYDNAQTTDENRSLWALVDVLSAKAANNFDVRRKLRTRSRYEIANNCWAMGIVNTTANDLIGTGPNLRVTTSDKAANRQIESAYGQWARAVAFTEKLRTQTLAKRADGEGFLILVNYSRIDSPVQLYPRDIEADQITTPDPRSIKTMWVDGMELDEIGNPTVYHMLEQHPGDMFTTTLNTLKAKRIAARHVIHWFRKDRPGQVRGLPELTPALELFGEMRRYRRAVLGAAETAASIAAYLKTQGPAGLDANVEAGTPFERINIERDTMMTLPAGYDINQLRAEQPTTSYDAFQEKLLAEACRTLNVPLNVALGTSQKFNFSSAKLDHLNYHAAIRIERQHCEEVVLDPVLNAWLDEAIMVPGLLPAGLDIAELPHEWHWPGFPYLDPLTDAKADSERLLNRTQSYARFYAERGQDWEEELAQIGREKELMDSLGLTPEDVDQAKQATEEESVA